MNIGNAIFGKNISSTPRIGIGNRDPQYTLDVSGKIRSDATLPTDAPQVVATKGYVDGRSVQTEVGEVGRPGSRWNGDYSVYVPFAKPFREMPKVVVQIA